MREDGVHLSFDGYPFIPKLRPARGKYTTRSSPAAGRAGAGGRTSASGDAEQFDLELQRRVGRDHAARAPFTVGDPCRAGELGLAADLHALHAFGPALDDLVERELGRLVAAVGAVELPSVG